MKSKGTFDIPSTIADFLLPDSIGAAYFSLAVVDRGTTGPEVAPEWVRPELSRS